MIPGASTLRCRAKGFFYTENMWAAEPGRPLILKKCHIVVWVNIDLPLSSCKEIARNAIITDGHLSLIAKVQNCFVFRPKWWVPYQDMYKFTYTNNICAICTQKILYDKCKDSAISLSKKLAHTHIVTLFDAQTFCF